MRILNKPFILLIIILAVLITASCSKKPPADPTSRQLARCMDDITKIPVMAGVIKLNNREGRENKSKPLEGMRIALTINGLVKSEGKPERGVDSWCEFENSQENFDKIIAALKKNQMPPTVAFIVGQNADQKILRQWMVNGNLLGNLTYSHAKIRRKSPQSFLDDITRNDKLLAPLLEEYSQSAKYFRYPRLKLGRKADIKAMIEKYLQDEKYVSVLGSLELPTDIFSDIYCAALARQEQTCATLITDHFKKLMLDSTLKSRAIARKRVGSDIRHILIVRSNQFLCDNLDAILSWYRSMGAEFITLDEALKEPVYSMFDEKGRAVSRQIISNVKTRQIIAREK
jgi:hypothetical protein